MQDVTITAQSSIITLLKFNALRLKTIHEVITPISLAITPSKLTQDGVDCENLSWTEIPEIADNELFT